MFDFTFVIVGAMLFVAYANGANDNFKGVATLFGSGVADYRNALWWATAATLAGSLTAFFVATELISLFQGRDLVPSFLIQSPKFIAAVIFGAALTVFAATKIGMPISTTHSLTGALVGTAVAAAGFNLNIAALLENFFFPLLMSPLIAVALSFLAFPVLNSAMRRGGFDRQTCVCVGNEFPSAAVTPKGVMLSQSSNTPRIIIDSEAQCVARLTGTIWGISTQRLIDYGHCLSAGAVSFARGLNDTPKIVALGLAASALNLQWAVGCVAAAMALGGLLNSRKVAETVGRRITGMDADHGFLANVVTSFLVIFASKWGIPVSTTHVSCGSLFGIGVANGQAKWGMIRSILLAWVLTLPFAAAGAGFIYLVLTRFSVA